MASRNASQYDSDTFDKMDKMPTNTLKRNPKNVDLTKTELLRLLSYLEGELQARDVTIAALKAEKSKQLLYQAKYGRFGLGDPFHALQRDSDCQRDNSFDETAVKAMYDNQLMQLENLIETQRKAQMRMREQLVAVEKRYHKVCAELEDEKRRHAKDAEEGDNVTCMLEKERERLKQELDFEKAQNKKLEKELKKTNISTEEEKSVAGKHKHVAVKLIKERSILVEKIVLLHQRNTQLEQILKEEQSKTKEMAEGISQESQKAHQMEASLEKCLSDFDTEREQLRLKLTREESKNKELTLEVDRLKFQIDQIQRQVVQEKRVDGPKTIEIMSSLGNKMTSVSSPLSNKTERVASPNLTTASSSPRSQVGQNKVFKNTQSASHPEVRNVPVVHVRNSPDGGETLSTSGVQKSQIDTSTTVKRAMKSYDNGQQQLDNTSKIITAPVTNILEQQNSNTYITPTSVGGGINKPIPAEKPVELQGTKVNQSGSSVLSMSGGTTVFTTPSGTRISLNVGPSNSAAAAASVSPRKSGLAPSTAAAATGSSISNNTHNKGTPPPIPPNKPQVFIPPNLSSPRKDSPGSVRPSFGSGNVGVTPVPVQHQTSKLSPRFTNVPFGNQRPSGHPQDVRKPPPQDEAAEHTSTTVKQSDSSFLSTHNHPTPLSNIQTTNDQTSTSGSSATLEFLGPEMDDLQQILVSMATEIDQGSSMTDCDQEGLTLKQNTKESHENGKPTTQGNTDILSTSINSPSKLDARLILQKYIQDTDWLGLQEYINHQKDNMNINQPLNYGNTVGHLVAEKGQQDCLRLVINLGANVNQTNHDGYSLLQSAVFSGQLACCKLLLEYGADLEIKNKEQLNVFHVAAKLGAISIFELLVEYCVNNSPLLLSKLLEETDMTSNNVVFVAAMQNTSDMLEIISKHCDIDIYIPNHNGKTLVDVASPACLSVLEKQEQQKLSCTVVIDVNYTSNPQTDQKTSVVPTVIGYMSVSKDTSWPQIEEQLSDILLNHFSSVYNGLRSKKTLLKTEAESPELQATPLSMGLSLDSVKYFGIGIYFWSPGTPSERRPFDLLKNSQLRQISIRLFGQDDVCMDNFAYESLIPLPQLHNYLRLMEQYGSVIFYGPVGSGKTFLCRKLAQIIQAKESQMGRLSEINFVAVHDKFTKSDLHSLLFQTGCLLHSSKPMSQNYTSILVLDGLEKSSVAGLFTDIATLLESRGPNTVVNLKFDNKDTQNYYLHSNCYILGTMDKTRLPTLDLSLQQSFRWVQFRNDQEPSRCLLHRHFYRQLLHQYSGSIPPQDDNVFKAIEWIICVWQRLNEGLLKLGLQDHVLGPASFLSCPVECSKSKQILRWLNNLWNQRISPSVSKAVVEGSGASTGGQQKVASTALYVLMQRSVVSGCPLTGQEKERYLNSFQGSNELDIKIRRDKIKGSTTSISRNDNIPNTLKGNTELKPNLSDSFTVDIDLSPEPQQSNGLMKSETNKNYFSVGRNPLQKSASLPSNNILIGNNNLSTVKNPLGNSNANSNLASGTNQPSFTLSPKIVNTIEAPKSFGTTMFALSGIPTPIKQDGLRNLRSNSLSNPPRSTSQFGRKALVGSPSLLQSANESVGVARSSGTRSATQSPLPSRFQGAPLSVPVSMESMSSNEINSCNTAISSAANRVGNNQMTENVASINSNKNIALNSRQGFGNQVTIPSSSGKSIETNDLNTITGHGFIGNGNNNTDVGQSVGISRFQGMSTPNRNEHLLQRQTVFNSKAGVTVQSYSSSDTSSLRRAFSPTPQQLAGIVDIQKPDNLRRSFSPSPDMIFSRRDDRGALPFSLPKK